MSAKNKFIYPRPYYILDNLILDEFVLGMLTLGTPLEMSIVGVFDTEGRGSHRAIDLPPHQDGKYSEALAKVQAGTYVEAKDIDIVGLYCLQQGSTPCFTTIGDTEIDLNQGEALLFNNNKVLHGRKGIVGERILIRLWIKAI